MPCKFFRTIPKPEDAGKPENSGCKNPPPEAAPAHCVIYYSWYSGAHSGYRVLGRVKEFINHIVTIT